ncbi:MAG: SIMPL domain-containing protein [Gammaproteobacteria bacterium]|nr:SIMPL domain-containing protein [Gammaproteobacteria bacterium]
MTTIAAVFSATSLAQEATDVYDRVDLSATAEREVENDTLIAIVYAEVEDNDQSDAADQVNRAISWAADQARRIAGVDLQTMQYNTRPVYASGSRRITGWIARQSLRLESQDAEALSELLGTLQERVAIQSTSYALSKEARDAAEEALIAEALARFNARAALIARELDRRGHRIVRISIGTSGAFPMMYQETIVTGARLRADVAAPTVEAGVQTVSVSVNGTIELDAE